MHTRPSRAKGLALLAFTLILVALNSAGCVAPPAPASAWLASSMQTISEQSGPEPTPLCPSAARVDLVGCANETLSFQLVVDAAVAGPVRLKWSDFRDAQSVPLTTTLRAYRALPVEVGQTAPWYSRLYAAPPPARLYDALLPIDGPFDLTLVAGERHVLWFDLPIAPDAMPGDYRGTISLTAGGATIWQGELSLSVLDAVLGDAPMLASLGGFEHSQLFRALLVRGGKPFDPVRLDRRQEDVRAGLVLLRSLMQLGREHRLDLMDVQLRPLLKRDLAGAIRLDWGDYDAIALPYLDGTGLGDGVGVAAWPMPVSADWPPSEHYGGLGSLEHREVFEQVLRASVEHFKSIPAARGKLFVWPLRDADGASDSTSPRAAADLATMTQLVRSAAPDLPLLSPLAPEMTSSEMASSLADVAGPVMAAPPGMFFAADDDRSARRNDSLAGAYLRPGDPPGAPSLDALAGGADARALPWLAYRFGARGLLIPRAFEWSGGSPTYQAGPQLVYPYGQGEPKLLASAQLKRLRRGMEDLQYLDLLNVRKRGKVADEVAATLARHVGQAGGGAGAGLFGWSRSAAVWESAHRLLAYELAAAVGQHSDPQLAVARSAWRGTVERTAMLEIHQARATAIDPAGSQVRVDLTLRNNWPVEAMVQAQLGPLPSGWSALAPDRISLPLRPSGEAHVQLLAAAAEGDAPDGKWPLAVELDPQHEPPLRVEAPYCRVRAAWTDRPPTIDGRLDDWPALVGNSAGDFRQLQRLDVPAGTAADQPTRVRLMRDATRLYVAVQCRQEAAPSARPDSLVHYRGLEAYGEDLVELVLDPGRTARDAAGLYHVVVKANGIVRARRGIEISPALGPVEPWPAQIASAVGSGPGEWTVELAIPLAAMGTGGSEAEQSVIPADARSTRGPVTADAAAIARPGHVAQPVSAWGINISRHCAADGQSSNWADEPRNIYDPASLGLLILDKP